MLGDLRVPLLEKIGRTNDDRRRREQDLTRFAVELAPARSSLKRRRLDICAWVVANRGRTTGITFSCLLLEDLEMLLPRSLMPCSGCSGHVHQGRHFRASLWMSLLDISRRNFRILVFCCQNYGQADESFPRRSALLLSESGAVPHTLTPWSRPESHRDRPETHIDPVETHRS